MSKKEKKIPAKKPTGLREKYLLVLKAFVSEESNLIWGKEMKIAKKLWEKFPEARFWETLVGFRKVESLGWIFNPQDLHEIGKRFEKFKQDSLELKNPTAYHLGEKIGEDRPSFKPSPKTLLDFIRN